MSLVGSAGLFRHSLRLAVSTKGAVTVAAATIRNGRVAAAAFPAIGPSEYSIIRKLCNVYLYLNQCAPKWSRYHVSGDTLHATVGLGDTPSLAAIVD